MNTKCVSLPTAILFSITCMKQKILSTRDHPALKPFRCSNWKGWYSSSKTVFSTSPYNLLVVPVTDKLLYLSHRSSLPLLCTDVIHGVFHSVGTFSPFTYQLNKAISMTINFLGPFFFFNSTAIQFLEDSEKSLTLIYIFSSKQADILVSLINTHFTKIIVVTDRYRKATYGQIQGDYKRQELWFQPHVHIASSVGLLATFSSEKLKMLNNG